MPVFRYFIRLNYNGARYNGWQMQRNALSVQEVVTRALCDILAKEVSLVGCGRTDTGVHAREFFAHFDLPQPLTKNRMERLAFRLNRYLPPDIAVQSVFRVDPFLHARYNAISRTYRYYIHTEKDPFMENISWFIFGGLDVPLMNEAAKILTMTSDFTSFAKLHSASKTNNCRVSTASWEQQAHRLVFTITADRFLRNMVRAIVGTLVRLGQHKIGLPEFLSVIEGKDRSLAGSSAPAHGLFLERVEYPLLGETGDLSQADEEVNRGHDGVGKFHKSSSQETDE